LIRTAALTLALLHAALGCGNDTPEGPSSELVGDARALLEMVMGDPATAALADVDRTVEDGRPVRAAELLRAGGIPAARAQVERCGDAAATSPEGRTLRRRAMRAYEARVAALELYAAALERGPVEDTQLVDALAAQRRADEDLLAVHRRLEELVASSRGAPARP